MRTRKYFNSVVRDENNCATFQHFFCHCLRASFVLLCGPEQLFHFLATLSFIFRFAEPSRSVMPSRRAGISFFINYRHEINCMFVKFYVLLIFIFIAFRFLFEQLEQLVSCAGWKLQGFIISLLRMLRDISRSRHLIYKSISCRSKSERAL